MAGIFAGLKVIDAATYVAGPSTATILGDFGATVIKLEPPGGDAYRMLATAPGQPRSETDYPWMLDNRGKRGLMLDLKRADAQAVLHRMIISTDVFVTNTVPRLRTGLGIGPDTLAALNPRLIYAALTAYGETGPEADKTGFDATAYWARSGLMDLVKSDAGAPPARSVAGMGASGSGAVPWTLRTEGLIRRAPPRTDNDAARASSETTTAASFPSASSICPSCRRPMTSTRCSLCAAIDRRSRSVHLAVTDDEPERSAIAVLQGAAAAFPFRFTHVLTANGSCYASLCSGLRPARRRAPHH